MRVILVALILGILTIVAAEENSRTDFEYEDDGAPIPSSAPSSLAPPTARGRGLSQRLAKPIPLSNRINKLPTGDKSSAQKSTTTTTTTTAQPVEVDENQDYDSEQGGEENQGEVTSTEAPKRMSKQHLRTNRNDDNLKALLKRKRQERINALKTSSERPTSTTTISTPVQQHYHNKNSGSENRRSRGRTQIGSYKPSAPSQPSQSSNEAAPEVETPKKSQPRKFNSRNSARTTAAPVVEEEVEEQPVEQPRPKFSNRGSSRRF